MKKDLKSVIHYTLRMDNPFYLAKHLGDIIVDSTRKYYPNEMLKIGSKLYIIANASVIEATTKNVIPVQSLEEFVDYIEGKRESAVVVSFSQSDFEKFSSVIDTRQFWSISEEFSGSTHYRVHSYGNRSKNKPPKCQKPPVIDGWHEAEALFC